MTNAQAELILLEAGYDTGWALCEGALILWEHVEDPPPPLVRPAT